MKKLVVIVSSLVLLLSAGLSVAAINIDIGNTMKPGGSEEAALKKFKELVETKSNGEIKVSIFMSGQLGGERAVLDLLKINQVQMALDGGFSLEFFAKEYCPGALIFYMTSWDCIERYMNGPKAEKIRTLLKERGGLIYLGSQKRAPRHVTSNHPIKGPDDFKGFKIRVPEGPHWVKPFQTLGAVPVILPATEIYLAMKTGQITGHENSLVSPYTRKMWEVQKYVSLTSHGFFGWEWVASAAWFDKLSATHQNLIRGAANEARAYGGKVEDEKDQFYRKELEKNGMIFIEPDRNAIFKAAYPAIKELLKEKDPETIKEVEGMGCVSKP